MSYGIKGTVNNDYIVEYATVTEINSDGIIISLSSGNDGIIPVAYLEHHNTNISEFCVGERFDVFPVVKKHKGGRREHETMRGFPVFKLTGKSNSGHVYTSIKLDRIKYGYHIAFENLSEEAKREYLSKVLWEMLWTDTDAFNQLDRFCESSQNKIDDSVKRLLKVKYVLAVDGSLPDRTNELMCEMRTAEKLFWLESKGDSKIIDITEYIKKKSQLNAEHNGSSVKEYILNEYKAKKPDVHGKSYEKSSNNEVYAEESANNTIFCNDGLLAEPIYAQYIVNMLTCLKQIVAVWDCTKWLDKQEATTYADKFNKFFAESLDNFPLSKQQVDGLIEYVFFVIQMIETYEADYPDVILLKSLKMETLEEAASYSMMKESAPAAAVAFYECQRNKLVEDSDMVSDVELRFALINKKLILPYILTGQIREAMKAGNDAVKIISDLCKDDPEQYANDYIEICSNLGGIYLDSNELDMAEKVLYQCIEKIRYFPKAITNRFDFIMLGLVLSENLRKLKIKKRKGIRF